MAVIPSRECETKLQERLSAPNIWKELCLVKFTNKGILQNPYLTDATVGSGTRGTGYDSTRSETVDSTVAITDYDYSAQHMDAADIAQKSFSDFMEIADNMAVMLDEKMETSMMLEHAQFTNFDNASIGGAAGNITVAISNIKKIIATIKETIRTAGGEKKAQRNGIFIHWREEDFTLVELLASSEGFNTADDALKNGIKQGFRYLGVEHYSTSKNVTNHIWGGVKKCLTVGVVKDTYGKFDTIQNPVVSNKQISGVGFHSRIDRKFKLWDKNVPLVYDMLVA